MAYSSLTQSTIRAKLIQKEGFQPRLTTAAIKTIMTTPSTPIIKTPDSPLAIASMVCGVLSLSGFGILLGIPALILGIIALKQRRSGRGLSIAGIVTGSISTLISLIIIIIALFFIVVGGDSYTNPTPSNTSPTTHYIPSKT